MENYIGVFDSGVGGLSVLKELIKELPNEDFCFFGDSANAPYGERTEEEIKELTTKQINKFFDEGAKAVVIACNTATSATAESLRSQYKDKIIIGMEPALKKAISEEKRRRVLVMATPMTLKLQKYHKLKEQFSDKAEFISLPCPKLVNLIEIGDFDNIEIKNVLNELLAKYKENIDVIVLGCTHYPFIKKQIQEIVPNVEIVDGNQGTAVNLKKKLQNGNLLNPKTCCGKITLLSSNESEEEILLYDQLLKKQ